MVVLSIAAASDGRYLIRGESLVKTTLIACSAILLTTASAPATMLFDFGNTARQTPEAEGWNNIVPATTELFAIFDENGDVVPGVSLEITDTFFQTGEPSQVGSEAPSGDAAGYPVSATDDYFFGHTGPFAGAEDNPYGEVTLSGLDPSVAYDFSFFSARNGINDSRQTQFIVTGANNGSVLATTSNNDTEVNHVLGIMPDANNQIAIGVQAGPDNDNGSGFFYINLMEVSPGVIPEPTSVGLLMMGSLFAMAKRRRR